MIFPIINRNLGVCLSISLFERVRKLYFQVFMTCLVPLLKLLEDRSHLYQRSSLDHYWTIRIHQPASPSVPWLVLQASAQDGISCSFHGLCPHSAVLLPGHLEMILIELVPIDQSCPVRLHRQNTFWGFPFLLGPDVTAYRHPLSSF